MKRVFQIAVLLTLLFAERSVVAQMIHRSELTVYETRTAAVNGDHSRTLRHFMYLPKPLGTVGGIEMVGSKVDLPVAWSDYNVYLHLENTVKAYDLAVNGKIVAAVEDGYTPHDFFISPYLVQGMNELVLLLRTSQLQQLNIGSKPSMREQFSSCYVYAQHRLSVFDYDVRIDTDSVGNAQLMLDIHAHNNFNYAEPMTIGYDIYSPDGKLLDYSVRDIKVEGRTIDTLRIRRNIGTSAGEWHRKNPALYRLTIYTKRNGKPQEYIPLRCGVGRATYRDGKILIAGKPLDIRAIEYTPQEGRRTVREEIRSLFGEGYNTLIPSTPQPMWFYDLCDEMGMYVIEQAAINPTSESHNRRIGGTPSNNPLLADDYIERVREMYYRTRNRQCIIAYSLGGAKAGNGYAMYKAYEWLRSVEQDRAIICRSADGEWNSDIDWKEPQQ